MKTAGRYVALVLIATVVARGSLRAQCADGSAPPCRSVSPRAMPPTPPAMSVAVLDFENLSRDTTDRYLSEGLAEELTSQLGQLGRLQVSSRSAVRRLRNVSTMSLKDISSALNASYIVTGSMRRSGSRLRVTAELVRASTGSQVWSNQYDRSQADLLVIQEQVATAVAGAVAGSLLPVERVTLATRPTHSAEAYDLFLRASLLNRLGVPAQQPQAVALLQSAIALDSAFVSAWAMLSRVQSTMFWFYVDRSKERIDAARVAAERAVALAPNAADAHVALGYYYYYGSRDYGRALQEFSAALVARSRDPEVHAALSAVARCQGAWEQSLTSRARAIELDPGSFTQLTEQGLTYAALHRYDEAAREYGRALAPPADFIYAHMFDASLTLSREGSLAGASARLEYLAAHAEDFAERTYHDAGALLPVWRAPGPHHAAILKAAPGPTAEARALHWLVAGQALEADGRHTEAKAANDSVVAIVGGLLGKRPDDDGFHAQISLAYAELGRCDDAVREAKRATELLPVALDALTGPQRLQNLAEVYALCGRVDDAVRQLESLLTQPSFVTCALLRVDPVYAAIRGDSRFQRLVSATPP